MDTEIQQEPIEEPQELMDIKKTPTELRQKAKEELDAVIELHRPEKQKIIADLAVKINKIDGKLASDILAISTEISNTEDKAQQKLLRGTKLVREQALKNAAKIERKKLTTHADDQILDIDNIIKHEKELIDDKLKEQLGWVKLEEAASKKLAKEQEAVIKKELSVTERADRLKAKTDAKIEAMEAAQEEKDKVQSAAQAALQQKYINWIEDEDIHFVANECLYYFFNSNYSKWERIPFKSLQKMDSSLLYKEAEEVFSNTLKEMDRIKKCVEMTFETDIPPDHLNMLRMDHWLKPKKGKHHELFDVILRSLGDGKQENIDHIEHVLWYKYSNPKEFTLPCMVIFGQGGVGKNLFVEKICGTIFGKRCTAVIDAEELTGFNELILGKVITFIDEAGNTKSKMDQLKRIIMNKTINVNVKYGSKFPAFNTSLYMMGSNDLMSSVQLANDDSDRRWSILKTDHTLLEHINNHYNFGIEYTKPGDLLKYKHVKDIRDYMSDQIFTDRTEVAKFLGYLRDKWEGKPKPDALHGADFEELIQSQKRTEVILFEETFNDNFKFISLKTLYEIYGIKHKEENLNDTRPYGQRNFRECAKKWLRDNHKHNIKFIQTANCTRDGRPTTCGGFGITPFVGRYELPSQAQEIINRVSIKHKNQPLDIGSFEFLPEEN